MKHLPALCVILLLAGCSSERRKAEKAYDAIGGIVLASSRPDLEARTRDADVALDEAKKSLSNEKYSALLDYRYASIHFADAGPNQESKDIFDACKDDAIREIYGSEPTMTKTHPGDCKRLNDAKFQKTQQEVDAILKGK
jgi:hypothetical protein